ncbi:MAG: histidine phosphatase family protein [Pyrinomonadaceae bacterium]|nr:histidine phosphatase family protein [Pyrinomonadaceae bacterium]
MKKLLILRHAKSSWDNPELSDFDRPLNKRGKTAAPFMGSLIAERGQLPDAIVSSPAKRAAETATLVREHGNVPADIKFDERIYEASPQALRQVVSETADDVESLMVVGHNPGMEGFLLFLTGRLRPMPTAALAIVELNIDSWSEIFANSGRLIELIKPKEEMARAAGGDVSTS